MSEAPRPDSRGEHHRAGPASALADRLLVHTTWEAGSTLIGSMASPPDGVVLCGKDPRAGAQQLRVSGFDGVVIVDRQAYKEFATAETPFTLPAGGGGLFDLGLQQMLQQDRGCGANLAFTPTRYLRASDHRALTAAVDLGARVDQDDVVFSVPIDAAWLREKNITALVDELARVTIPKAVLLGGQFNPIRVNEQVANLRRLVLEVPPVAVFRTDLTGLDVLAHGGLAASIGTTASLRHVVPPGQFPRAADRTDRSPSVLVPELLTFFRGSTLAKRFAGAPAPTCSCPSCGGRGLDDFLDQRDAAAAGTHALHVCGQLVRELLAQPTLHERASWWRHRCQAALGAYEAVNRRLHQTDALAPPPPLSAWANLST